MEQRQQLWQVGHKIMIVICARHASRPRGRVPQRCTVSRLAERSAPRRGHGRVLRDTVKSDWERKAGQGGVGQGARGWQPGRGGHDTSLYTLFGLKRQLNSTPLTKMFDGVPWMHPRSLLSAHRRSERTTNSGNSAGREKAKEGGEFQAYQHGRKRIIKGSTDISFTKSSNVGKDSRQPKPRRRYS
jgi:hypothetical protein